MVSGGYGWNGAVAWVCWAGSDMTMPTARAGVPTGLSRDASQAEPLIAIAEWWANDPEFNEWLDEMERQNYERTIRSDG